jgi:Flp pilus assembly protein TadG
MRLRLSACEKRCRPGVAAVEMAVLLPVLAFLFVITVDFARIYYDTLTLVNCARNGAVYGSQDPTHATDTAGIQAAALQDATNLTPSPTVSSTTGTDSAGFPYIDVTVSWTFQSITNYVGVPASVNLTRTVRMRIIPAVPNNS